MRQTYAARQKPSEPARNQITTNPGRASRASGYAWCPLREAWRAWKTNLPWKGIERCTSHTRSRTDVNSQGGAIGLATRRGKTDQSRRQS